MSQDQKEKRKRRFQRTIGPGSDPMASKNGQQNTDNDSIVTERSLAARGIDPNSHYLVSVTGLCSNDLRNGAPGQVIGRQLPANHLNAFGPPGADAVDAVLSGRFNVIQEIAMKYMILLYAEPGAWPPDEHQTAIAESVQVCHQLHSRGQYLGASPLQPASTAACVRVRDGKAVVSDGPYAETKEQLGGYFLVDAVDINEAIAIAARIPGARRGTAEIRPIMAVAGLPEIGNPW